MILLFLGSYTWSFWYPPSNVFVCLTLQDGILLTLLFEVKIQIPCLPTSSFICFSSYFFFLRNNFIKFCLICRGFGLTLFNFYFFFSSAFFFFLIFYSHFECFGCLPQECVQPLDNKRNHPRIHWKHQSLMKGFLSLALLRIQEENIYNHCID